jgi:ATP-dependent Clp protease ATP-binding subunit ClpC
MFERYTDRARRVITLTQQAQQDMRHEDADTGHLLVGLIGEGGGVACQALTALGVTPERVREAVWTRHPGGDATPAAYLPFSPRLKKALEMALRESMMRGDNFIGTEHLLLGLIREGSDVGALALAACASPSDVRAKVLELLDGYERPAAGGEDAVTVVPEIVRIGPPLPGPLMCFRCVTGTCGCGDETVRSSVHGGGMVPAITMLSGTLLCQDCADRAPVF